MKLLNILKQMLLENSTSTYDYGCVMVYFNFPELQNIQSKIKSEDIYSQPEGERTFGLEDEPHVTCLYGLHKEVTTDQIKQIIDQYQFGHKPFVAHTVSHFIHEDYDVLKFDVEGEILYSINKDLVQLPHTTDFPDYHPHLTIGYLKPGMGYKCIEQFKGLKYNLNPEYVIYSKPDGTKDKIEIKKN